MPSLHDTSLVSDDHPHSKQLAEWLTKDGGGDAVKYQGKSVVFQGFKRRSMNLLARSFHLNSVGVRQLSLTGFTTLHKARNQKWDEVHDYPIMMLVPAQNERECPLSPWQMDVLEGYLSDRMAEDRSVFLSFDQSIPEVAWWSTDFMEMISNVGGSTLTSDEYGRTRR